MESNITYADIAKHQVYHSVLNSSVMKRLLVLIPVFLASCVEPINMDSDEKMPIVVKCILTRDESLDDNTDPVQYLDLYYAKKKSMASYKTIKEAKVEINGHEFVWNGSRWQCSFLPAFNKIYTLNIEIADGKTISSSMTFPPDCLLGKYSLIDDSSLDIYTSSLASYYYIRSNPKTFDVFHGSCILWIQALDDGIAVEKICTSHPGVDNFNIRSDVWSDCDVFNFFQYDFEALRALYENPPAFMDQKYIDSKIWSRYSDKWMSSPLHDKVLRIQHPENFDSGMPLSLENYICYSIKKPVEPRDLFILGADIRLDKTVGSDGELHYFLDLTKDLRYDVRFVSEEYDKYLKTMVDTRRVHGDELTSIYSPDPVYTNIEGGLGCFGGQWITTVKIDKK